jgi:hypothetical protein
VELARRRRSKAHTDGRGRIGHQCPFGVDLACGRGASFLSYTVSL